jgi:hypothetical protein
MKNMNDLLLLCREFGFLSLLSQVSDILAAPQASEDEGRKDLSDILEEKT